MIDSGWISRLNRFSKFRNKRLDKAFYDELPAICILLDTNLCVYKINRFGCEQLGYSLDELIGKPVHYLCSADERELYIEKLHNCIAGSDDLHRIELIRVRKDGSRYWVRDTIRVIALDGSNPQILIVSEDITETRYLIDELERQVSIDVLTGLYNRRRFDRHLEQAILSAKIESTTHVLGFIDLDQFKVVNDACGHLAGDELLRQIAHLLQQQIRGNDILARLGGDEFGLILDSCSISEAESVCNKIRTALSQHRFTWDKEIFTLGASIGLQTINSNSTTASDALRHADTACYMAKDKGRNCIKIYDELDSETQNRGKQMKVLSQLHTAFEHDRFVLFQQSIRPLRDESASTAFYELLIRMQNENGELVAPGSFIPAAEYYGLSSKIDRWVTIEALRNLANMTPEQGTDIVYFVNLSGLTLGDTEFIEEVSKMLEEQHHPRCKLCFEITETAAIQNFSTAIKFIEHFRARNCMFALDDFGSGFSSFAYLKTLPVDFIKIDGEFVKNIIHEPIQLAIVQAIHQVADVSGKKTIAEHVEDEHVLNVLRGLGIDYGQGYYFDHPSPLKQTQEQKK
jgi:diguanylate cyclase (GGDEF)-like protein/PAS domain S-box-containing protein